MTPSNMYCSVFVDFILHGEYLCQIDGYSDKGTKKFWKEKNNAQEKYNSISNNLRQGGIKNKKIMELFIVF